MILLLLSSLVENGAGTGWTVKGKLSQINSLFVKLFNLLNTTRCGKLLYSEMNTHSTKPNGVKMSSTWGQSAWIIIISACSTLLLRSNKTVLYAAIEMKYFFVIILSKISHNAGQEQAGVFK